VWVFENLGKSKKCWGPLVSLRRCINGAWSLASRLCASCSATHRWPQHRCGRWPRTPPRVPYPLARDCSGETPTCFDTSSCHLAASTPLLSTAFLDHEDLHGASPLRPTPGLIFTSLTSPASPTSTPLTPHRSPTFHQAHRHRKPTPVSLPPSKTPNWVPHLAISL
jgi:hypothetical protein